MFDVEDYLSEKKWPYQHAGPHEVHGPCVFCSEDDFKRGRLYINTDPMAEPPGLFNCFLCGERGAINKLRKHFGDPVLREDDKIETNFRVSQIMQISADHYYQNIAEHEQAYDYLTQERGFTFETIENHKLGWSDGSSLFPILYAKGFTDEEIIASGMMDSYGREFLANRITIPYMSYGTVVQIRGRTMEDGIAKYKTPSGQPARLFNADKVIGQKEVIIVEGEADQMILEQYGFCAVGLPGAATWQPHWNDYLSDATRIYICMDTDEAGIAGAEKVNIALGSRAKIVKMPEAEEGEKKNDPNEWLVHKEHSADDFRLLLIKSRGGLLLSVDEAYEEWEEDLTSPGLKLGIEAIDFRIQPGIKPGQVAIFLSKSGGGKTTALLNLFYRMMVLDPDLKIMFVSLEQTRSEWFERARRIYRFYNLDANDKDCLEFFRDRFYLVDKNRLTEQELTGCVEQFEFETGEKPGLIAVDYLGYWARGFKGEAYERTGAAIHALKAIAKDLRVSIFAPHQVNRGVKNGELIEADDARDAGYVEETADFVFSLTSEDNFKGRKEDEKTGIVQMKINKSRHGGKDAIAALQFAPLSLAMIPHGDQLQMRAKAERRMYEQRDSFEEAIYRHATGDAGIIIDPMELREWQLTLGLNRS